MDWNDRYVDGDLPWETGRVDSNLSEAVVNFRIAPCNTLELGCGTGNNAIWLAKKGFDVVAVDLSERAIKLAGEKVSAAGVNVELSCDDIMADGFPYGPFEFVFDRGCFHSVDAACRKEFAAIVRKRLVAGGLWLSLLGSSDGPDRDEGPPRLSAAEIVSAVESSFEIVSLTSTEFDSDMDERPRAWRCLLRRR